MKDEMDLGHWNSHPMFDHDHEKNSIYDFVSMNDLNQQKNSSSYSAKEQSCIYIVRHAVIGGKNGMQ